MTQLAQWIVTVVTDDQAMDRIFKTSGRSLLKNAKGKIFINCATVSPATHLKVEKRARKVGARTLEACMASSITQARQGTLYLMCGGDRRTYKRVEPLLKDLSASMRYIGASGKASEVKALVNMVMNINTAGLAEGWAWELRWAMTWACCVKFSRKQVLTPGCWKPMVKTCNIETMTAIFPLLTQPKTLALLFPWQNPLAFHCPWLRQPFNSMP